MQPLLVWRHFLPVLLFAGIASTKGTAASFLNSAKPDDFKRLNAAFADAVPEARQILRELERSAAIYQTFLAGQGWQSNLDRSRLAKEHFSTCYRQAQQKGETLPRALFKYGAFVVIGKSAKDRKSKGDLVKLIGAYTGEDYLPTLKSLGY